MTAFKHKKLKTTDRVLGVRDTSTGNEPLIDAFRINAQWGKLWPKVVARAWRVQESQKPTAQTKPPIEDTEWLENLMSGEPALVRKSLEQEGFSPTIRFNDAQRQGQGIVDIAQIDDEEWFWENIKIVVKDHQDGVQLLGADGPFGKIKAYAKSPQKYTYKQPELVREIEIEDSPTIKLYNQSNGWAKLKEIGHVLILTLPPKPDNVADHAVALAEYESAGLVYPFTFCC